MFGFRVFFLSSPHKMQEFDTRGLRFTSKHVFSFRLQKIIDLSQAQDCGYKVTASLTLQAGVDFFNI